MQGTTLCSPYTGLWTAEPQCMNRLKHKGKWNIVIPWLNQTQPSRVLTQLLTDISVVWNLSTRDFLEGNGYSLDWIEDILEGTFCECAVQSPTEGSAHIEAGTGGVVRRMPTGWQSILVIAWVIQGVIFVSESNSLPHDWCHFLVGLPIILLQTWLSYCDPFLDPTLGISMIVQCEQFSISQVLYPVLCDLLFILW